MELGSGENVGIYAEAKSEYTRQLSSYLIHALHKQFLKLLDDAKGKEADSRKVLLVFQQLLEEIPDWNQDKVQRETHHITVLTNCDYLEELLTAVFIAHTKVLSAIRLSTRQKKLQITIPKLDHFLHKTFIECARILWSNAYLFAASGSSVDRQKNQRTIEQLIQDGVLQAIRAMLPVKSILKEYLRDEEVGDDDDTDAKPTEVDIDTNVPVMETAESLQIEGWKDVPAEPAPVTAKEPAPVTAKEPETSSHKEDITPVPAPQPAEPAEPAEPAAESESKAKPAPTIIIDTSPTNVSFTNMNAVYDSENVDNTVMKEMPENDDEEIHIMDEVLEMDDFETLP